MNTGMLESAAYQDNVEVLKKRGVFFVGPECGHLACGDNGNGRMSEPETIMQVVDKLMASC